MRPRIGMVLNRRLDAAFVEMEIAWGIYKAQRTPENFRRYLGALRRCRMLDELLKHS